MFVFLSEGLTRFSKATLMRLKKGNIESMFNNVQILMKYTSILAFLEEKVSNSGVKLFMLEMIDTYICNPYKYQHMTRSGTNYMGR